MQPTIAIYQNYYSDKQLTCLDKQFIPHNNANAPHPEYREYPIFLKFYETGIYQQADYTGIMSWKFGAKTEISGNQFIQFINDHPGHDVYFINPFPAEERFQSVWAQGDLCHPGLIALTQDVFDQIGYDIDIKNLLTTCQTSAYCNFWVGNQTFWDRYIAFTKPVYEYIINAPESIRQQFFIRADRKSDSVYFPFVMERLFTTLLTINRDINYLKYEYSADFLKKHYSTELANYILGMRTLDKGDPALARQYFTNAKPDTLLGALKKYGTRKLAGGLRKVGLSRLS